MAGELAHNNSRQNTHIHPIKHHRFCLSNLRDDINGDKHEVVLICFEEDKHYMTIFMIKGTLALVSVLFVAATLYVYYLIPQLRETQDKVTCVALGCMMMWMLLLGVTQIAGVSIWGPMCHIMGSYRENCNASTQNRDQEE